MPSPSKKRSTKSTSKNRKSFPLSRGQEPLVENLETAHYRCHFPRCGGVCCKNGRPGVTPEEINCIEKHLKKFLPLMRPEARKKLEKLGFMTKRFKDGRKTMALSHGWCIFNHDGCVLQKVGMAEGDKWKYKPHICVLFPVDSVDGREEQWFIRQKGYRVEGWDELYCLSRTLTEKKPARESIKDELEYLKSFCRKHCR